MVCETVRRVIFHAQRMSQPMVVGWPSLEYINQRDFGGEERTGKPMNTRQRRNTINKYAGVWERIVCYIWRTYQMKSVGRGEKRTRTKVRPPYFLSARLQGMMNNIRWNMQIYDNEEEQSNQSEAATSEGSRFMVDLEDIVFEFILGLLKDEVMDKQFDSPINSALAVLGITDDGGWKSLLIYTLILSAVVTIRRMLVMFKANCVHRQEVKRLIDEEGLEEAVAERRALSHYSQVMEIANEFMGVVNSGEVNHPMSYILGVRSYGLKIRYNTVDDGKIIWKGNTISYGNIDLSMSKLRSMMHGLVETAREQLCKELLLMEYDSKNWKKSLPEIRWGKISDNPAEMRANWELFEDLRNEFTVDRKIWLSDRVIDDAKLREEFWDEEMIEMKLARVKLYAKAMRQIREKYLVCMHIAGG